MIPFFALASLAAFASFLVHTFVGGRYASRPLLEARELPKATVWLNYFTWHIATVHLFIMAAVLAAGAVGLVDRDAVFLVGVLAASISVLSIAVTLKANIPPLRFPASYLLGLTSILAFAGLQ